MPRSFTGGCGVLADAELAGGRILRAGLTDVQSLLREFGGRMGQSTPYVWTAVPCGRRPSRASARVTTGPSGRKGSKVHITVGTLGHLWP
jgi:hypothetical protein